MTSEQSAKFVQKGAAAQLALRHDGPAQEFYFLLLDKATMLPLSAAIEPLRIANQVTNSELFRWFVMSADGAPVTCSNGLTVTPDTTLSPLPPEAIGFVCAGVEPHLSASEPALAWLRREYRFGRRLGGICTGAFALAEAGLLEGRRFTLHWENQPGFQEAYPRLTPSSHIYEIDGRLMTCGGGNAATDMMLALIEERHGNRLATIVADMCLHVRSSGRGAPQKSHYAAAIGSRNPHLLQALELMQDAIEDPIGITDLCRSLDVSRRQLERLFQKYLGRSPKSVYFDMRLNRAFALVGETSLPVADIAAATGFNSAAHFSRQFKQRYGASPYYFRKGWA